jgi:hypothetical protein
LDLRLDLGFAQIVHCNQPSTIDAAAGDGTQIVPGTDAGADVRIVFTPIAASANTAYFGNDAKTGATSHLDVRIEASAENDLFVAQPAPKNSPAFSCNRPPTKLTSGACICTRPWDRLH